MVLALVAGNAFFVIGEYSIVTARRGALAARAEAGSRAAAAALRLMDQPVRVISTVQVGITAIGILTGAIGEPLVGDMLGDGLPEWVTFLIAFGVVTYLSVVFGELVPKALTLERSETLATIVARPVEALTVAFRPVVWVLEGSAHLLLRPFGISKVVAGSGVRTAEELRDIVDQAEGEGVIPTAQEELLHNVFDFASREARDVMVPAAEVSWLDAACTAEEAIARMVATPHSRYPVADGSIDRVIGTVHVREVVVASRADPAAAIGAHAAPAYVVPERKDLGALLRELREARQQLAVVVDEYGRTSGIVSIHDIVEELVGDIQDEYDLPDDTLTWEDERTVTVAGSMTVDDFNEEVGTALPQQDAHTIAGLVFHALGRRPDPGDSVDFGDVTLRVEAMDAARIARVRVSLGAAE